MKQAITQAIHHKGAAAAVVIGIAVSMVIAVHVFHQSAALVPEMGAVGSGLLFFRNRAWLDQLIPFYSYIVLAAIFGLGMSMYVDAPIWLKIPLALGVVFTGLVILKVPALPALSAGLLPIYLDIHSWWYPVAVAALMGIEALVALVLLRPSFRRDRATSWELEHVGKVVGSLVVALLMMAIFGSPLLMVPPLLVAMSERAQHLSRTHPVLDDIITMIWLVTPFELSIGLLLLTHDPYVVVISLLVAYVGSTILKKQIGPVFALAMVPLLFGYATDERLIGFALIGSVVAQFSPLVAAKAVKVLSSNRASIAQ
ncbi:hypothetical protein [Ferrimicrobium acidiphilum]|jgi:hypothetical protein|uniref:hypothetical protein n=1 Tax=Ferrimicrobium acidiphilum TaxID=121039 RepID=UPI0023F1133A|nr:hypothetical protein [Ferrimicrobium acidiphilum]MCL5052907.1 hypothetical protein [Gammaproteobacteria bacterium]